MSFVTYDNFWDEVKLYCHSQAKKADGLGFILSKIDSPEAQAWIAYCHDKGWPQRAAYFEKMLKANNALTMPCADPRKFEPGYAPSRNSREGAYEPRGRASSDPQDRRTIAEQVRAVVANSRPPRDRRRDDHQQRPLTHAEILDGLREKGRAEPVALSPALADRLGLRRFDEAAE